MSAKERFSHPYKKCFVLFSNQWGISQSTPLRGPAFSLAHRPVSRFDMICNSPSLSPSLVDIVLFGLPVFKTCLLGRGFHTLIKNVSLSPNRCGISQLVMYSNVDLNFIIYKMKQCSLWIEHVSISVTLSVNHVNDDECFIFSVRFGIEGPVYLSGKGEKQSGEWFVDEQEQKIKKLDGSLAYNILQAVRIHMEVVEPHPNRPKLQLTLL